MMIAATPIPVGVRRGRRASRVRLEAELLVATLSPLAGTARASLARQPELLAPVKLALSARGGLELRAELLRGRGVDAESLARRELALAKVWLADTAAPVSGVGGPDAEAIAAGLAELPKAWTWEPREDGSFQVHATAFGTSARLSIEACNGTARAHVNSAVPAGSRDTREALVQFALETNARLRLARIGVATADDSAARLTWDAVAPPGVALERSLPAAVEAVVAAHAVTQRALRALSHAGVARAYLDARCKAAARGSSRPAAGKGKRRES
jgi:hypothetical protein